MNKINYKNNLTLLNFDINQIESDLDLYKIILDRFFTKESSLDLFSVRGILTYEDLLEVNNSFNREIENIKINLNKLLEIILLETNESYKIEELYMNIIILEFNSFKDSLSPFVKYI